MSYQTKEQSVGYILHGALKSSIPANELLSIARAAKKIIPVSNTITNDDTLEFTLRVGEELEWTAEQIKDFRSEVYYQFDMKTVEEAGNVFEAFSMLFPVLKK